MRIETAKLVDKKYLTVLILIGRCDNRPCKNKASIVANLDGDVFQFCNDCFNLLQQLRDQKRAEQPVAAELATPLDPALICPHGTVPANMCYICNPPIR